MVVMRRTIAVIMGVVAVGASLILTPLAAEGAIPQSTQIAGYVATAPASSPLTAQAQFALPAITCINQNDLEIAQPEVLLAGSPFAGATVDEMCQNGAVSYVDNLYAGGFVNPTSINLSPGDEIILRVRWDSGATFDAQRATIDDLTTGVTQFVSSKSVAVGSPSTVSVGTTSYGPTNPDFGKIEWVKVAVVGSSLGSLAPQAYNLVRTAHLSHPRILITTSPLSPSGSSFRNTWVRS